jgi:hypothetical protein
MAAGLREVDFDAVQFAGRLLADAIEACKLAARAAGVMDPRRVADADTTAAPTTVLEVDPDPAAGRADWSAGMGPTARERARQTGIAFGLDGEPSVMARLVVGCEPCRWRLRADWDCLSWLADGEQLAVMLAATVDELMDRFRPPCPHWKEFKALMLAESLAYSVLSQRIWGDESAEGSAPAPVKAVPAGGKQPSGLGIPPEATSAAVGAVTGHGVRLAEAVRAVRELLGMGLRPDQLSAVTVAARCVPR